MAFLKSLNDVIVLILSESYCKKAIIVIVNKLT